MSSEQEFCARIQCDLKYKQLHRLDLYQKLEILSDAAKYDVATSAAWIEGQPK